MSDVLEKNTILISVPDSIISGKTVNAGDYNEPFTFLNFLIKTNSSESDSEFLVSQYKYYLLQWYKYKKIDKIESTDFVRSTFVGFLREVLLNFSTLEERRFVTNADFNNDLDLYSVIPFFTKKIKEICNYYSLLRQNVPFKKYENSLKGSQAGVKTLIKNEIFKALKAIELVSNQTNLFDLSSVKNNIGLEINELYDESQYFDLNPDLPATTYNKTFSSDFYTSNTNEFNTKLFTDFDKTIIDAITAYPFFLNDLNTSYSINFQVNSDDLQYLKDRDFINQINNLEKNNLNLNLEKDLIQKFIGTDYYYLSVGNTLSDIASGLLFEAEDKSTNFLNKRFPSAAAVENESNLKNIRQIGGFFLPDKLGVLNFNNFKHTVDIDNNKLKTNKVYVFPDPSQYGNITNLSETDFESPLIYEEDVSWMHFNRTAQYLFGNIVSNPLYKNFYAYHSRSETIGYQPIGMSRDIDSTEFFEGSSKSVWANSDVYPVQDNLYPLEQRQSNLLVLNKTLTKYKNDIYGNNFGLYKEINPVGIGRGGKNRGQFISEQELDFFNFTGGRGGLYGTGRKGLNINNFTNLRIKNCLLLDGYKFYDFDSGFNIDLTIPNPDKDISGVTSRTVSQIPPGSGYYTSLSARGINRLLPGVDPYANYVINFPYNAPVRFTPLPTPLLVIAYGKGHFCEVQQDGSCIDTYCDIFKVTYCVLLDCVTFVDPLSNLRLDVSSDRSDFNSSVPVYYSELLEGSLNDDYTRPNNVDRATFSYTFPLSANVLVDLEGFRFNLAGETPCAISNSATTVRPGTLNYRDDNAEFVNLAVPTEYQTSVQALSTNLDKNKSIYESRYEEIGNLYVKNANTTNVNTLDIALSTVYEKYPSFVVDNIKQGVVNFELIYNVLFIETKDYFIFDKLSYNYIENIIEPFDSSKNFVKIYNNNKKLEKFSTLFFNEKQNIAYIAKMVLIPELSASNKKVLYPEIYEINITNPQFLKIYPTFNVSYENLSGFYVHLDDDTNIERIDKPVLSYNEDTNTFVLNYFAKNSNNVFVNIYHEFYINNANVDFIKHIAYKPEFFIKDLNFSVTLPLTAFYGNTITGQFSSYQNKDESILWFGTSASPSLIVGEFVNCDAGLIFSPVVTPTPSPQPTLTPTPTVTNPVPTPTPLPWNNLCPDALVINVSGAGLTAANGNYTLTAAYTRLISPSAFTVFYANTANPNFTLVFVSDFNSDSSYVKGLILSSTNNWTSDIGFVYASTQPINEFACAPYGYYNTITAKSPVSSSGGPVGTNITIKGNPPYPYVQRVV